jgi:LysM repeat protein
MQVKKFVQLIVIAMLLITSFAWTGNVLAWSQCSTYITVQWGDTLSGIAKLCDTTVNAIRAANPGLGWWLYAGQTLYIPSGDTPGNPPASGGTYVVKSGDTLGKIAAKSGTSLSALLAVNPKIYNASLIYTGQVINLPAGVSVPPPTNYPPPPNNPPPPFESYASLKIDYSYGMYIRSDPGGPIIASALDKTSWYYKLNSVFIDKNYKVWVQVKISPSVKGYSTGWLLVKDQLGTYFTNPHIDN